MEHEQLSNLFMNRMCTVVKHVHGMYTVIKRVHEQNVQSYRRNQELPLGGTELVKRRRGKFYTKK